jgi:hypothetical protein
MNAQLPEQVHLSLTGQELQQLLSLLIEAPYRVVAPLIQKIGEQTRAQQMMPPPPMPMPARPNGDASHAPD